MVGPAISVVIVAYRQREALAEALDSCLQAAANVDGQVELIVVDNGDLAGFVRARWPHARLLEPGENLGYAGGVQRGLALAGGEWVALVNDDVRVETEALDALLQAGRRDPRIGSVAAQVRFQSDPAVLNSAGIEVDSLGIATERLAGRPAGEAVRAREVFGATAACGLYRRRMLDAVGGFDERFFAYLEDVDLAWRARAAGWIAVYEPRAIAYHRGSASFGGSSRQKYFLVGRNRMWLLARNATTPQLLRSLPGIVLYELAYVTYAALADRTLEPLRGRLAGLSGWRSMRREGRSRRRAVALGSALHGWLAALRVRRAYDAFAGRAGQP